MDAGNVNPATRAKQTFLCVAASNPTCTDSDSGLNYYVKGTVRDSDGVTSADYCEPTKTGLLMEGYCSSGGTTFKSYICSGTCSDGACPNTCTGSNTQTCTVTNGIGTQSRTCSNGVWSSWNTCTVTSCNSGYTLTNGVCVIVSTCTDSDGGANTLVSGFAQVGNTILTDRCNLQIFNGQNYQYNLVTDCVGIDCYVNEAICDNYSMYNGVLGIGNKLLSCPNGCSNGKCINATTTCTDSDGGNNYYVKGTVVVNNNGIIFSDSDSCEIKSWNPTLNWWEGTVVQSCASGSNNNLYSDVNPSGSKANQCIVLERSCKLSPIIAGDELYCPNGCSNGACINATTPTCTDSDGGKNIYVAGLTDGRVNGLGSYYNDKCVTTNGGACSGTACAAVAEGYCTNNSVTNTLMQCPSGYCSNGVCANATATCTDSDGGNNIYVAGEATGTNKGTFDVCDIQYGTNRLREAVCDSKGIPTHLNVTCPTTAPYCNRAVCGAVPPICTDSDGGINALVKGTTVDSRLKEGLNYTDYCENSTTSISVQKCSGGASCGLREFSCSGITIVNSDINCPNGCSNGACINMTTNVTTCGATGKAGDEPCEVCGNGLINGDEICDPLYPPTMARNCSFFNPQWTGKTTCNSTCNGYDFSTCTTAQTCTDSDGGYNLDIKGFTTDTRTNTVTWDTCNSGNYIYEQICTTNGTAQAAIMYCIHGCSDGKCINVSQHYPMYLIENDFGSYKYMNSEYRLMNDINYSFEMYTASYSLNGSIYSTGYSVSVNIYPDFNIANENLEKYLSGRNSSDIQSVSLSNGQTVYHIDSGSWHEVYYSIYTWTSGNSMIVLTKTSYAAESAVSNDALVLAYSDKYQHIPTATCNDSIWNGDETGIDCGGSCDVCSVEYNMSSYPSPFIANGAPNALFIVGKKAAVDDVIGITDVVTSLQRYASSTVFPVGIVKFDDQVSTSDLYNNNLIIVGGMCANDALKKVYSDLDDCTSKDTKGIGHIKILSNKNNGKYIILVHGYNAEDTTRATKVLAQWTEYADVFNGATSICVSGSDESIQAYKC